jgi:hypothetical protein
MPLKKKKKNACKAKLKTSKGRKMDSKKVSDFEPLETPLACETDVVDQHPTAAPVDDEPFPLMDLPLEVRSMVYGYVLGGMNLEIGERRALRHRSTINRFNRFTLTNFTVDNFALLRTSTQIRREARPAFSSPTFTITSTKALEGFLGYRTVYPGIEADKIDEQILDLLQKAVKIEIQIEKRHGGWDVPMGTVGWLGTTLEHPENIMLVDKASKDKLPGYQFDDAVARWKRFALTL